MTCFQNRRNCGHRLRLGRFALVLLTMSLSGCNGLASGQREVEPSASIQQEDGAHADLQPSGVAPASQSSLITGSSLALLAERLDAVAISRSSALQDVQAARAALRAQRFERYPQLRPSASAPLIGNGAPVVGLTVEQTLWDGGRHRAALSDIELKLERARLVAWRERNKLVFDGLRAFVDIARYEDRVAEYTLLAREMTSIKTRLQARLEGGVADRGEMLRMASALQQIERRVLSDTASLRQAQADFVSALPQAGLEPNLSDLDAADSQCRRDWPQSEAPADAMVRVALSSAEASEDRVKAKRFPQLVLSGGSSYSRGGLSEPSVGLRLDASDLLGLGRRGNLEAATASTRSAEASYRVQLDDTRSELARLDADYQALRADISSLLALSRENDETLSLFNEQLEAGSIGFIDGIVLHRERTDTRIALVDARADILLNCLRASQHRGLLAPLGVYDAQD